MSIYVECDCKCGDTVLMESFDDLERALHHLKSLYRECGENPICQACDAEAQSKSKAEDLRNMTPRGEG